LHCILNQDSREVLLIIKHVNTIAPRVFTSLHLIAVESVIAMCGWFCHFVGAILMDGWYE